MINLNSGVEMQSIITVVLFIITIFQFFGGAKRTSKEEIEKETERNAKINWKLDQLCKSIDDVKIESKNTGKLLEVINMKIFSLEKDNSMHAKEIDNLKERVTKIEEKGE